MLTGEQVEAIAARLMAATPGEWEFWDKHGRPFYDKHPSLGGRVIGHSGDDDFGLLIGGRNHSLETVADAAFIAHAPEDIAALLAERAALLEILRLARAECQWREAREAAAMEIVEMVARAMVICGHAPQPDVLCPNYRDGKAWPLRTKARAMLGLSWVQEPKQERKP